MRSKSLWDEMAVSNAEYEMAYDTIRYAMTLVEEYEYKLLRLKNVLHVASVFVNKELDELPDQTKELGLDKWQQDEVEQEELEEELEREMRERQQEWERQQEDKAKVKAMPNRKDGD